jgi:hypothetical protein
MSGQKDSIVASQAVPQPLIDEDRRGPVVIELYTSQGCSSCPPADDVIGSLSAPNILPLSLSVDYWDYIGWPDTFGKSIFSDRQRRYAALARSSRIYTPQAIFDGSIELVGSNRSGVASAIQRCLRNQPPLEVKISFSGEELLIIVSGSTEECKGAHILLFDVLKDAAVKVLRGENSGRTLKFHNVVTDLRVVGTVSGDTSLRLPCQPPSSGTGFAVLVQHDGVGPVLGAASYSLS